MFMFHVAFALDLIALSAGSALYVYSGRSNAAGTCYANTIAMLIIVFSITSTLCTSFYGVKYWLEGYFQNPMCMMDGIVTQDHPLMKNKNMSGSSKTQ